MSIQQLLFITGIELIWILFEGQPQLLFFSRNACHLERIFFFSSCFLFPIRSARVTLKKSGGGGRRRRRRRKTGTKTPTGLWRALRGESSELRATKLAEIVIESYDWLGGRHYCSHSSWVTYGSFWRCHRSPYKLYTCNIIISYKRERRKERKNRYEPTYIIIMPTRTITMYWWPWEWSKIPVWVKKCIIYTGRVRDY